MKEALELVKNGKSFRAAAKEKNLAYPTLQRYWSKITDERVARYTPNYQWKRIFTDQQEATLAKYLIDCSKMFYGLTLQDTRRLAYETILLFRNSDTIKKRAVSSG